VEIPSTISRAAAAAITRGQRALAGRCLDRDEFLIDGPRDVDIPVIAIHQVDHIARPDRRPRVLVIERGFSS
jgi:hypothetical protein